jgi:hypothetical protein
MKSEENIQSVHTVCVCDLQGGATHQSLRNACQTSHMLTKQGGHLIEYVILPQSLRTPSFMSETESEAPKFDNHASRLASLGIAAESS